MMVTYIKFIGFSCEEVVINSGWINRAKKGADLKYHYHTNAYVSGNYFVNFDTQKHSSLIFQNDRKKGSNYRQTIEIPRLSNKDTSYNIDACSLPATEGQILLWRSHLTHGYIYPNKSNDRCTLSFNSLPKVLSTGSYSFTASEY